MCKKCSSGLTYRAGGLILPFKLLEGNGRALLELAYTALRLGLLAALVRPHWTRPIGLNLLFFAENILKKLFDDVFPQFLRVEVGETRKRGKSILLNCIPK